MTHIKDFAILELQNPRQIFAKIRDELQKVPEPPEELPKMRQYIEKHMNTPNEKEWILDTAVERNTFLEGYKFEISDEECRFKCEAVPMLLKLNADMEETRSCPGD